ncbi:hypothetical protein K458DRAFT_389207 [Lentithecium fluviatile CBS 122367]|uniref:Zn(2)-C6 fungal-type domain-containing protein n=1 Tax=Lentithecium fluviatile CBS 122367 TaxID=1168545 RepID=A0A6G1J0F6_9PLEO|nr:hypothetical protein K458DRAFT_389207 [Lentithecium fluviatile CBS 122367]
MLPESQRKGSCKPCRESNAQCDKKKPRCSECISSNKHCGGYDMGNIFINVNSTGPPPIWNRSQHAQKYLVLDLASQPAASHQYPETTASALPAASSAPVTPSYPSIEALTASMNAMAPPSLPPYTGPGGADPNELPAMVTRFLDLYYKRHEAHAQAFTPGNEHAGWRALLPSWIGQSPMLDSAIGALASSFVGMQCQDDTVVNQGRTMYLRTLQMAQQALPESDNSRWHLLATTLVMSSVELFLGNGGGPSQLTHIEGATQLLQSTINSTEFNELHAYILNQGLWEALSTRRNYAFSLDEYRQPVRHIYSAPRTNGIDLFFQWSETILPLPSILNVIDSLASSTTAVTSALSTLERIATLEQYLSPWSERLKATIQGPWTPPVAQVGADSVPFPLQFVSIEACTLYCLYWTSQLLLLEARQIIYPYLPAVISRHPESHTLQPQMTEYASFICRSVQFSTQDASYATTENMFLPLFIAASYYKRQGDEERRRWCMGEFTKIAVQQKIGFAAEMLDFVEQRLIVQEAYTF